MLAVSQTDVQKRIARDNFWWASDKQIPEAAHPRRVYFESFKAMALNFDVKRAAVLLGPRRVGKTFMIKQLIHQAIIEGISKQNILFVSIDTPVYLGMALERFLEFMPQSDEHSRKLVIFDEIQYLRDWEIHLKDLVDNYPQVRFIATGSAAAALRLKSRESGAGRFSDFMLPPLTFYEFLMFLGKADELMIEPQNGIGFYGTRDIELLNSLFIDYLNYGGYPEAVLNKDIRDDPEQFIRNDIIDRVLLKDLPSLYGIHEIRDLAKLFSFLAYNAGNEASLENICQGSGLTKPTIKRYIEYLESAFLLIKIPNVDENCKSLQRERNFKIYLNNPSMRAALFGPVETSDTRSIGHLAESAIFSQWQHATGFRDLRYARWKNEGEVDIVLLSPYDQKPQWIGEIKWSDRIERHFNETTQSMKIMLEKHRTIRDAFCTSKTVFGYKTLSERQLNIVPSSVYCYTVGKNVTTPLSERVRLPPHNDGAEVDASEI